MSRSYRRVHHRNQDWMSQSDDWYTSKGPESCCMPGCNTCGKGPKNKRIEHKKNRRTERLDIERDLA